MAKNYKKDFPIFENNPKMVYLDSAATAQKPKIVLDAMNDFYTRYNANAHSGFYTISMKAEKEVEKSRATIAHFINAREEEIIFTKNATEAINCVARAYGEKFLKRGDEIVVSVAEHHSNFVPWVQLARARGARVKFLDIDNDGHIKLATIKNSITRRTKIFAITHVSNMLGIINPIEAIIKEAKKINPRIITLVDASQSIGHIPVNVKKINCDFLAFSGHKCFGPLGVGVLYGKKEILDAMDNFITGGNTIQSVSKDKIVFRDAPYRFEAGTMPFTEIVGLGKAIAYSKKIGLENIHHYNQKLITYALKEMLKIKNIVIYGDRITKRTSIISFNIKDIHPHDAVDFFASKNICVRGGFHCAEPLHHRLNAEQGSVRISMHLYNTKRDIDLFIKALKECIKIFSEK